MRLHSERQCNMLHCVGQCSPNAGCPSKEGKPVAAKPSDLPPDFALGTGKDPFLAALGERTRALRARRGLTRKGLAKAADVSERHLANVEMGVGNASIQFLRQAPPGLNCKLAPLDGAEKARAPQSLRIRRTPRGP